jgi:hypothetical protein
VSVTTQLFGLDNELPSTFVTTFCNMASGLRIYLRVIMSSREVMDLHEGDKRYGRHERTQARTTVPERQGDRGGQKRDLMPATVWKG